MTDPQVRTPISAYILAAISFLFVTGGIYFVALGAIVVFARSLRDSPSLMLALLMWMAFLGGPVLGGISAWESVKKAHAKAVQKALASVKPTRPCPSCGEAVEVTLAKCPMCGKEMPAA